MKTHRIIEPLEIQPDLPNLISTAYGPTSVTANQFFVAYNAVITLAYQGFSKSLLEIKSLIENKIGEKISEENFSSKWPKTTLGSIKQKIPLTNEQLIHLRSVCNDFSKTIQSLPEKERILKVNTLKIVVFKNRTLENRLLELPIPLNRATSFEDEPTNAHLDYVKSVMHEFDESNHEKYYPLVATTNRTIANYYRVTHIETTLIADACLSTPLKNIILDFQKTVNKELPRCYTWFDPESWHLTIRALVPKKRD